MRYVERRRHAPTTTIPEKILITVGLGLSAFVAYRLALEVWCAAYAVWGWLHG
jgi:hypothetical protein